jgi:hypothetical protein
MKKLSLSLLIMLFTLTSSNVWSNPGFRDLKPGTGMTPEEVEKICTGSTYDGKFLRYYVRCYGIEDIQFKPGGTKTLEFLSLDMGPIVASDGSFFSELNNLVVSSYDEPNIYLKMKKNFDSKYTLNYEYSERDRQLFNEGLKNELLGVYSDGQVTLKIMRKERDYSKDLWLYIDYRGESAKDHLELKRPVKATLDDF